jgi:hypothetical protein
VRAARNIVDDDSDEFRLPKNLCDASVQRLLIAVSLRRGLVLWAKAVSSLLPDHAP